ncbi:unnamed protein product [Lactuca saligna]|uniref:Uncharacterized protein n=1 Tax=Lactuca saligna TaxID=75948 RepID=A0AA35VS56_LACSI|nr:unnamed protein product [Lactuca saligna]
MSCSSTFGSVWLTRLKSIYVFLSKMKVALPWKILGLIYILLWSLMKSRKESKGVLNLDIGGRCLQMGSLQDFWAEICNCRSPIFLFHYSTPMQKQVVAQNFNQEMSNYNCNEGISRGGNIREGQQRVIRCFNTG